MKNLMKISSRRMAHWKIYDLFRYDLPRFFRNLWVFRKDLWNYNNYNGAHSILPLVKTSLDDIAKYIDKYSFEETVSKNKKVEKMKRLSYLLDIFLKDDYMGLAEKELGPIINTEIVWEPSGDGMTYRMIDTGLPEEKSHNLKVMRRSKEIAQDHWEEIIAIIKGPDYKAIFDNSDDFDSQYDGSDMRAWWH